MWKVSWPPDRVWISLPSVSVPGPRVEQREDEQLRGAALQLTVERSVSSPWRSADRERRSWSTPIAHWRMSRYSTASTCRPASRHPNRILTRPSPAAYDFARRGRYLHVRMRMTTTRTAAVLLAMVAALALASPDVSSNFRTQQHSDEDEAQLADVLRNIDAENLARAAAGQPRSRNDKANIVRGAVNFFRPFRGGNGRSCATCHNPLDGFSLSPATVEARWQRLQRARQHNPSAMTRSSALLMPTMPTGFHAAADARARQGARAAAESGAAYRQPDIYTCDAVARGTPLNMLKHTAPYQQDRTARTLEEQALGAVNPHMEPTVQPTKEFLESVAEFQRHIFSSAKVKKLSDAIDAGGPIPDIDPPLTEFEQLGKEKFNNYCGQCHGGPAQVLNLENRIFPPHRRLNEPGLGQHRGLEPAAERSSRQPHPGSGLRSADPAVHRGSAQRHHRRARVERSWTVLTDVQGARNGRRKPGIQPIRHPSTARHQRDRPVLPRSPRQDPRGRREALPGRSSFSSTPCAASSAVDSR